MINIRCCLLLLLFPFLLIGQDKLFTLEDIYEKGTFSAKGVPHFSFMQDGLHYSRMTGTQISKYAIADGKEVEILFDASSQSSLKGKLESYSFNRDETKLLLATGSESIYRYSFVAEYFVYDRVTKKLDRIFPKGKIKYPSFDPTGTKVAFVFENNLYYQDLNDQKIIQITKDGVINKIINGASDWVYEEEFTLTKAYEWSPSGDQIAFIRFDESRVKEFTLEYYRNEVYPEKYTFKYPKVGEDNAILTVWNYHLKKKKAKPLNIGPREDDYLPRMLWTLDNNELCVSWMNRDQNHLKLILINTKANTSRILLEEKSKYYIDVQDHLKFLENQKFLWSSGMDGYKHLYLYNMNGTLDKQLTSGNEEMSEFYGFNDDKTKILCQFAVNSGLERQVRLVDVRTGVSLPIGSTTGYQSVQASPGLKYLVLSSSNIKSPTQYTIIDSQGNKVRDLELNLTLATKMKDYKLSEVELTKIPNSSGTLMNAAIIKPKDFVLGKKYPVFMFLYGGPGSQQVMNRWNSFGYYWWLQMLAQKDYIICVVDNRGTGGRGEEFKKMTYLQLGKYETEDQIDAAKYLGKLDFVDAGRIGIFGWSYGGYMSSLCLLKGNDVFKSAIAVAPVTNWKWYDSIYTERYMRRTKDNAKGYEENSPVNFADRLKGNYLLVHGMADDNVHFQNTIEMADALIKNRKQFETYYYPNKNHGIGGLHARMHLFTKMTDFVLNKI
ncbi:MAG: S9 family peptidase [Saprospiraceae bacterium]|nr:S9 family peptidase [Saprospiraceae bacterium]